MAKMQRKPKESPMSCSENTNATVGDLVIRPATPDVDSTDFDGRHAAILAGEKAAAALLPELKAGLARARANRR